VKNKFQTTVKENEVENLGLTVELDLVGGCECVKAGPRY
jgi:hypothetical protein